MKPKLTDQKLRGGYYTPIEISNFLSKWAIDKATDSILEPSCGDGSILQPAAKRLEDLGASKDDIEEQLLGIELDPSEAEKANMKIGTESVKTSDFFSYTLNNLYNNNKFFDVILGNPPFIRYQNFVEEYREIAFELMKKSGFSPNRLTNIWVPFLVLSSLMLKPNGKIGMVIPAELFQVGYASETRKFLSEFYDRLTIITFKELVFPDAQQEVVLLLGERSATENPGIRTVELQNVHELASLNLQEIYELPVKDIDHSSEKWTKYFLDNDEIQLLRELKNHPHINMSSEIIDVDVGVVTGQNKFFVHSKETLETHPVLRHTKRIVGRSNHLQGAIFSNEDFLANVEKGYPTYLFYPSEEEQSQPSLEVANFIKFGENQNVHKGYKCSIRKKWYVVPSVWVPDAFMLRQVHEFPKIILNEAKATCTDTIHRVRFINGYIPRQVSAAFLNSLTFAFSEITGRSYGGGVLTFEPSESENLPIPLKNAERLDLELIDRLLREGKINEILDITDQVLLIDGLGLTDTEVRKARFIWEKLKNRRINRKKSRKKIKYLSYKKQQI